MKRSAILPAFLVWTLLPFLPPAVLHAQGPAGGRDPGFNADPSAFGAGVNAVLALPDNSVLAGVDPQPAKIGDPVLDALGPAGRGATVAHFFADGTFDAGYARNLAASLPAGSNLQLLTAYPDGRALVLNRSFDHSDLLRLGADGTLDPTFQPGFSDDLDFGSRAVVQPDGKLLLVGTFDPIAGASVPGDIRLLRLNADGTADGSFRPALTPDAGSSLVLQPDGKIFVFSAGVPRRLNADGSLDGSFVPTAEVSYVPTTLAIQPADGKLLVGQTFLQASPSGGPPFRQYGLSRLNPDGSLDVTFQFQPDSELAGGSFFNEPPPLVLVQPDGKLLVGVKDFPLSDGADTLLRLRADGTPDFAFNSDVRISSFAGPSSGQTGSINAIALTMDGRLFVGGRNSTTSLISPSTSKTTGLLTRLLGDYSPKRAELTAQLRGVSGNQFPPGTVVTKYPIRATLRLENRSNKSVRAATVAAYVSDRTDYLDPPRSFRAADDPSLVPLSIQPLLNAEGALAGLKLRYGSGDAAVTLSLPKLSAGTRTELPVKFNLTPDQADTLRGKSLLLVVTPPTDLIRPEADDTNNVAEAHPLP